VILLDFAKVFDRVYCKRLHIKLEAIAVKSIQYFHNSRVIPSVEIQKKIEIIEAD
jgi:hypothetical protein